MADGAWRGISTVYVGAFCGSEEEALSAKPGPAITLQEIHSNEAHGIRPYDLNRR